MGKTWTIQVLSHIEKNDLADTSMSLMEKRMFISAVADAAAANANVAFGVSLEGATALPRPRRVASAASFAAETAVTVADEEAATATTEGVATKKAAVDAAAADRLAAEKSNMGETDTFLDNLGLFDGHKDELRALTGKNWTIDVLAYIDMDDLDDGTTMSLENKKLFLSKVAEHLEAAAAEEASSVAEAAAAKEAARVTAAAIAADTFLDGVGLTEHKTELQELTGATWSIERLSRLEKGDLSTTSMSLAEKKMLIVKAGKAAIDATAGEIAGFLVRETPPPHLPTAAVST